MSRVVVGLSGGVDSAVTALLLLRAGHQVTGLFMKTWDDGDGLCPAAEDYRVARAVADTLEIPLTRVDLSQAYWDRVFTRFLADHEAGLTPNPDVWCNREIKFDVGANHAWALGAELFATGHYARLQDGPSGVALVKARDKAKDQTYFLSSLSATQLARVRFPVGHLTKAEVRTLARDAGLPNHDRPDSTGICFIGERKHRAFLERFLARSPGEMRAVDGRVLGHHQGLAYYTIGQRAGLGIGGAGPAWYVVAKEPATNTLKVAQGDHQALYSQALIAHHAQWVADEPPRLPARLAAKTRYRQSDQAAWVESATDGRLRVTFDERQRAITPGQRVVFYEGDQCLGGATIEGTPPAGGASNSLSPMSEVCA